MPPCRLPTALPQGGDQGSTLLATAIPGQSDPIPGRYAVALPFLSNAAEAGQFRLIGIILVFAMPDERG